MPTNPLNFKKIEVLLTLQKKTKESLARRIGKTTSGLSKAIRNGSIRAEELPVMAEYFDMELLEFVAHLAGAAPDQAVKEDNEQYAVTKRKLSGIKDPLEYLRALMNSAEELDKILGKK